MSTGLSVFVSMSAWFGRRHGAGFNFVRYELMGTRVLSRRRLRWTYLVTFYKNGHQIAVGRLLKRGVDAYMLKSCMLCDGKGTALRLMVRRSRCSLRSKFNGSCDSWTTVSDYFGKRMIEWVKVLWYL